MCLCTNNLDITTRSSVAEILSFRQWTQSYSSFFTKNGLLVEGTVPVYNKTYLTLKTLVHFFAAAIHCELYVISHPCHLKYSKYEIGF